jgi:hypothetical protein
MTVQCTERKSAALSPTTSSIMLPFTITMLHGKYLQIFNMKPNFLGRRNLQSPLKHYGTKWQTFSWAIQRTENIVITSVRFHIFKPIKRKDKAVPVLN